MIVLPFLCYGVIEQKLSWHPKIIANFDSTPMSVAYSSDGKTAVIGERDGTVSFYSFASKKVVREWGTQSKIITSIAFSPDNKAVAFAGTEPRVQTYPQGNNILKLSNRFGSVWSVAFASSNKTLATTHFNFEDSKSFYNICLWNLVDGKLKWSASAGTPPTTLAFAKQSSIIASGDLSNTVRFWDASTGRLLRLFNKLGNVTVAAVSPDGKQIVASDAGTDTIKIWDVATMRVTRALRGNSKPVFNAMFSPDGQRIIASCNDNTIRVWDKQKGYSLRTLKGHTARVTATAFSPDSNALVSVGQDNVMHFWRLR